MYVAQKMASELCWLLLYHPTWTLAQRNCWVNMADKWIYLSYFIGRSPLIYYNWLLESFLHILNLWILASQWSLMKPGLHNHLFNFDILGLCVKGQLQRQWVIPRGFMWWYDLFWNLVCKMKAQMNTCYLWLGATWCCGKRIHTESSQTCVWQTVWPWIRGSLLRNSCFLESKMKILASQLLQVVII